MSDLGKLSQPTNLPPFMEGDISKNKTQQPKFKENTKYTLTQATTQKIKTNPQTPQ